MNTLLPRFVVSASCARLVNEGLTLAVVLLALDRSGSTATAGWLIAITTFPQLVTGPLLGPVLDRSPRPWRLLRLAGLATAAATLTIVASLDREPFAVPAVAALVIACTEPLLNGGVSAIAGRGPWSMRVFAWDSLAYNIAGLAGPALVTVVAIVASPGWALATLGLACAAVAVTSLGLSATAPAPTDTPDRRRLVPAIRLIVSVAPLRAATVSTTVAFAALGGLSFAVVAAVAALGRPAADAGFVMTAAAVGGLAGSLAMTRRPAPARPAATVLAALVATGVALAVMGLGSWQVLLAGAFVIGVLDAPLLVGLFTARSEHSPTTLRATVFTLAASAKLGAASIGAVVASQLLDGRATGAGLVAIGAVHVLAAAVGRVALTEIATTEVTAPEVTTTEVTSTEVTATPVASAVAPTLVDDGRPAVTPSAEPAGEQ